MKFYSLFMDGINFVDTIVVRRSIQKGTKTITEKAKSSPWSGQSFRDFEQKRMKKSGVKQISSGKGTQKIQLGSMKIAKIPDLNGRRLVSERGTKVVQIRG